MVRLESGNFLYLLFPPFFDCYDINNVTYHTYGMLMRMFQKSV